MWRERSGEGEVGGCSPGAGVLTLRGWPVTLASGVRLSPPALSSGTPVTIPAMFVSASVMLASRRVIGCSAYRLCGCCPGCLPRPAHGARCGRPLRCWAVVTRRSRG